MITSSCCVCAYTHTFKGINPLDHKRENKKGTSFEVPFPIYFVISTMLNASIS